MPDGKVCPDQFRGYLWKWTNYIKGYQKRWFIVSNGLFSYYRSPAEMNHTCRGTINLAGAFIDTIDSCSFVVSNGGSQVYHLRAGSEVDRQRWVTALELAKAKAMRMLSSADDEDDSDNEADLNVKTLGSKLEDLITCNNLVNNHGATLQRSLGEVTDKGQLLGILETKETKTSKEKIEKDNQDLGGKLKNINEKAQLFRITSNAMINACTEFLELAQAYEKKFQKLLNLERDRRVRLEETVETLALQHNRLEKACEKEVDMRVKSVSTSYLTSDKASVTVRLGNSDQPKESESEEDHDEFFDALCEYPEAFGLESPRIEHNEEPFLDFEDSISDTASTTEPYPRRLSQEKSIDTMTKREDSSLRRAASEQALETNKDQEMTHRRCLSQDLRGKFGTETTNNSASQAGQTQQVSKYRKEIPEKPNASINLWSIMKNCIGKELTKIPMPVNFNEPLSMTQRLTEELECSDLLDKAASCENSLEQICYLAAFTVSCYASTADRSGKPFNPLLGETYEWDRTEDLGWRSLAEQVSHHPPSLAHHAEGRGWILWQNFTMSSKFRGKYLMVTPQGTAHCKFTNSGNHYTWKKVTTTVNNIIVGRLWIDQSGEMDITNHSTGEKCHLKYHAYSYFSKELPKRVTGYVSDASKVTRYVLSGFWNKEFSLAKVVYKTPLQTPGGKVPQGTPTTKLGNPQTLPPTLLWSRTPLRENASKMYNFSEFSCSLNQPEVGVALTDSRLRPDQRAMENGNFDEANQVKLLLEEAQRARRKKREAEVEVAVKAGKPSEGYKPTWFERTKDDCSDLDIYVYKGGYWEAKEKGDWSMCPSIYEIPNR